MVPAFAQRAARGAAGCCAVGVWLLLVIGATGCGGGEGGSGNGGKRGREKSTAQAETGSEKPVPPVAKPPEPVAKNAYPNIPEALAALKRTATGDDEASKKERYQAVDWLAMQGAAAIAPLAENMNAASGAKEFRYLCCLALSKIGEPATDVLLAALESDVSNIRQRAFQTVAGLKPTRKIYDRFLELAQGDNTDGKKLGVEGLGRLGPSAKEAAPLLQEILNKSTDASLRTAAGKAIKSVSPRRSFEDK